MTWYRWFVLLVGLPLSALAGYDAVYHAAPASYLAILILVGSVLWFVEPFARLLTFGIFRLLWGGFDGDWEWAMTGELPERAEGDGGGE